ncbi:MAG TPA: hypothetical protein VLW51_00300 [Solirubrobacteraceae bacterium]|nr:hypothetical protein [Solirubrobacteraceae bacterium]
MTSDERGPSAAADQADAGPEVGRDLEVFGGVVVQGGHPALALGLRGPLEGLSALDRRRLERPT